MQYFHRPQLRVRLLSTRAIIPHRPNPGSVGFDLASAQDFTIPPRGRVQIPTQLVVYPPPGTCLRICGRRESFLAQQNAAVVPLLLDIDYDGEIFIPIVSQNDTALVVHHGDRLAQFIITPIVLPDVHIISSEPLERLFRFGLQPHVIVHPLERSYAHNGLLTVGGHDANPSSSTNQTFHLPVPPTQSSSTDELTNLTEDDMRILADLPNLEMDPCLAGVDETSNESGGESEDAE